MQETRVAIISDVHANRWALTAVLQDVERRGIQELVNLGDSLYGPLDPAGTACILVGMGIATVRGNEDRAITESSGLLEGSSTLCYVRQSLSPEHLQWLRELPVTGIAFDQFFLCHGSPTRDSEYLLQEVRRDGVVVRRTGDLARELSSCDQPVVLCGHDHVPRTVRLPHHLIVNPGSVGLPAYEDDHPHPHVMETGTPHARYSVLSRVDGGWRVEDVAVPYDWERAARVAMENGRADWARWLRTGRAGGD